MRKKANQMKKKLGFIGCGNMGEAMLAGALKAGFATAEEIIVHTHTPKTAQRLQEKYGVEIALSNQEVVQLSQCVILAVKPYLYPEVLAEITPVLAPEHMILGISPSFTLKHLATHCDHQAQVIRAMPNTPAMVGCGMTGVSFEADAPEPTKQFIKDFLGAFGEVVEVPEHLMKAVCAVSGSSPAFVYMMIEAMAQGAILQGLKKEDAYLFAAKAVEGAAKMVLQTDTHPAALRDNVCSAGGTTIEGVAALENAGFKSAILQAMQQTAQKFEKMEQAVH
jgi:pyrroline-5-carboxylate reductase